MEPSNKRIRFDTYSLNNNKYVLQRSTRLNVLLNKHSYNFVAVVKKFCYVYTNVSDDIKCVIMQYLVGYNIVMWGWRSLLPLELLPTTRFDEDCDCIVICWTLTPFIKLHEFFASNNQVVLFDPIQYINFCFLDHKDKFKLVLIQLKSLGKREYWWGYISECFMENAIYMEENMENFKYLKRRIHRQFINLVSCMILFRHGFPMSLMLYCLNKKFNKETRLDYGDFTLTALNYLAGMSIGVCCFNCARENCFCSYQIKSNKEVFICTNVESSNRNLTRDSLVSSDSLTGDLILNVYGCYYSELMNYKYNHSIYLYM